MRSLRRGALLTIILLVAAGLRLWRLDQFPPGLSVDEAYNLLDALDILRGARPIFLPDNAGREALYSYWQALFVALLGATPLALRLASAVIGIATVGLTVWCFAALPWRHARLTALVTAAILAGLFWHVTFSRFGIRAISLPLFETLLFGFMWRGVGTRRRAHYALAGLALGLAFYAGTAARVLPLVPALSLVGLAWLDRRHWRSYLGGLAVLLGVAAAAALPLAWYFGAYPARFTTHLNEVAVTGAELMANIPRVFGMFTLSGDTAWWRNLASRPVFDPLLGLAFVVGVVVVLVGRRTTDNGSWSMVDGRSSRVATGLCLVWLVVMLVPTWAADNAPNFSRAIGSLPVACVFPARALVSGWAWLAGRRPRWATPALVAVLVMSLGWTAWDYFGVFAGRPEPYYAYDAEKVAAGVALREEATRGVVYVSPGLGGHATVRAVTDGVDVRAYDMTRGVVLADGPATYASWANEALPWGLAELGATRREVLDAQGRPLLAVYNVPGQSPQAARAAFGMQPGQARFGEIVGLSGVRAATGRGEMWLMWSALGEITQDLTLFVHYVDPTGQTTAQADGEPLGASYPTSRWRVGERLVEWRAPQALPPGTYRVRVGWYNRLTGERLPLPGSADNSLDLGTVEVQP